MTKPKTKPSRPNRGSLLALSCQIEGLAKTVAGLAQDIARLSYRIRQIEDQIGRCR